MRGMAVSPTFDRVGEYRPLRLLGKGGMGAVYEAEAPGGRRVAVKTYSVQGRNVEFLKRRFIAEGRNSEGLSPREIAARFGVTYDAVKQGKSSLDRAVAVVERQLLKDL